MLIPRTSLLACPPCRGTWACRSARDAIPCALSDVTLTEAATLGEGRVRNAEVAIPEHWANFIITEVATLSVGQTTTLRGWPNPREFPSSLLVPNASNPDRSSQFFREAGLSPSSATLRVAIVTASDTRRDPIPEGLEIPRAVSLFKPTVGVPTTHRRLGGDSLNSPSESEAQPFSSALWFLHTPFG